jgi:hypothetical protein
LVGIFFYLYKRNFTKFKYAAAIAIGVVSRWFIDPAFNDLGTRVSLGYSAHADLTPSHSTIKFTFIVLEGFLSGTIGGAIAQGRGILVGTCVAIMPIIFVIILIVFEFSIGHGNAMLSVLQRGNETLKKLSWIMLWLPQIPTALGGYVGAKTTSRYEYT